MRILEFIRPYIQFLLTFLKILTQKSPKLKSKKTIANAFFLRFMK